MGKSIQKYDPNLINKARQAAGTRMPFRRMNEIKVAYEGENEGSFVVKEWDEEAKEMRERCLGETFNATIVAVTKCADQWTKKQIVYFSNEFSDYSEAITLVEKVVDGDDKAVSTGTWRDVRGKYPKIKVHQLVYLLIGESVYRLKAGGASFMPFSDFEKKVVEGGSTVQAFETVFSLKKERSGAVTYYVLQLEEGKENDLNEMVKWSLKVQETLRTMRNDFLSRHGNVGSVNDIAGELGGEEVPVEEEAPPFEDGDVPPPTK